mmetsp:Transcript_24948/g.42198  ORF Transcript_24948/g.42198 Transcript_24948/m.42198 type:complete len:94 (+) Transcript_24948:1042-1323(+)
MHSITIRLNKIVQKPLQPQKIAVGVPRTYNAKHVMSNKTFVARENVHSITKKLAEPRDVSMREPMVGKNKHMRRRVMRLFSTKGENTIRYTSK